MLENLDGCHAFAFERAGTGGFCFKDQLDWSFTFFGRISATSDA